MHVAELSDATAKAARRHAVRLSLGTASALGLARFAYGLAVPAMSRDLGWSLKDAGVMSAANGVGYLIGAVLTALIVRRIGTASAFRWGMVVIALALIATSASGEFLFLLIVRAMAGCGGAVVFIVGGVIAARLASRAALSLYFAGAGVGIVVSGLTIPALGDDWRLAWVLIGTAAGLATVVSWRSADQGAAASGDGGRVRLRPIWPLAVVYLLFSAGYITYITFLSVFLAGLRAPLWQVILFWILLGIAVVAAPRLWSRVMLAWPDSKRLVVLLALLSGGAALALVAPNPLVTLASVLVYGATFMGVPAATTALIKSSIPSHDWTATLAAFTLIFAVGQTAGPWIVGVIGSDGPAGLALAWTAAIVGLAAILALVAVLPRHSAVSHGGQLPDS